ncbi:MAG: hypothetical protein P8Y93_10820 [Acidobacteriota bacterium]
MKRIAPVTPPPPGSRGSGRRSETPATTRVAVDRHQAGERVESQDLDEQRGRFEAVEAVDDGRGEEEQVEKVADQVAHVAVVNREGRDRQHRPADRQRPRHQRQGHQPDGPREGMGARNRGDNHGRHQHGQGEEVVDEMGEHGDRRKDLRRAHHLGEQGPVVDQGHRGVENRAREKKPRQKAAEQKQRIRFAAGKARVKDVGEDAGVHREQQQRVEQRPEKAEDRGPVAGIELPAHEHRDQGAVPPQQSLNRHRING